ncbi:methylglutaconyl-CoA hydratase, mitochondrial-like [Paramacrobiotus metropolitanus]|uniref:methylglutaconyl-CoA hydratase, mitochondrial-like n=1 Tax=Paramacrobiotus metropolitanus TaxID=2943436 RepID=UPI002445F864|nr:methylglutaconyl-CoA hydratase, mitochondrial-like [Paramacrobiotus metropolitanus]
MIITSFLRNSRQLHPAFRSFSTCHSVCQIASNDAQPGKARTEEFYANKLTQDPHNGVLVFNLNRPEVRNAISKNLLKQFRACLESARQDTAVRAIILRSTTPGVFCSGADLKERMTMREEEVAPFVANLRNLMADLYNFPVPTIAALDGMALGGGLEMALACDVRVASSTAKIGLVETKLGIIPGAGGTQLLTRLVGPSRAKDLIFTGQVLDGAQAHAQGIVNHLVEQNSDGSAAYKKALEVAEPWVLNGPIALRMAKVAINRGVEVDLEAGLKIEEGCYAQIVKTKDRLEGLAAFKEKRKPKFRGE